MPPKAPKRTIEEVDAEYGALEAAWLSEKEKITKELFQLRNQVDGDRMHISSVEDLIRREKAMLDVEEKHHNFAGDQAQDTVEGLVADRQHFAAVLEDTTAAIEDASVVLQEKDAELQQLLDEIQAELALEEDSLARTATHGRHATSLETALEKEERLLEAKRAYAQEVLHPTPYHRTSIEAIVEKQKAALHSSAGSPSCGGGNPRTRVLILDGLTGTDRNCCLLETCVGARSSTGYETPIPLLVSQLRKLHHTAYSDIQVLGPPGASKDDLIGLEGFDVAALSTTQRDSIVMQYKKTLDEALWGPILSTPDNESYLAGSGILRGVVLVGGQCFRDAQGEIFFEVPTVAGDVPSMSVAVPLNELYALVIRRNPWKHSFLLIDCPLPRGDSKADERNELGPSTTRRTPLDYGFALFASPELPQPLVYRYSNNNDQTDNDNEDNNVKESTTTGPGAPLLLEGLTALLALHRDCAHHTVDLLQVADELAHWMRPNGAPSDGNALPQRLTPTDDALWQLFGVSATQSTTMVKEWKKTVPLYPLPIHEQCCFPPAAFRLMDLDFVGSDVVAFAGRVQEGPIQQQPGDCQQLGRGSSSSAPNANANATTVSYTPQLAKSLAAQPPSYMDQLGQGRQRLQVHFEHIFPPGEILDTSPKRDSHQGDDEQTQREVPSPPLPPPGQTMLSAKFLHELFFRRLKESVRSMYLRLASSGSSLRSIMMAGGEALLPSVLDAEMLEEGESGVPSYPLALRLVLLSPSAPSSGATTTTERFVKECFEQALYKTVQRDTDMTAVCRSTVVKPILMNSPPNGETESHQMKYEVTMQLGRASNSNASFGSELSVPLEKIPSILEQALERISSLTQLSIPAPPQLLDVAIGATVSIECCLPPELLSIRRGYENAQNATEPSPSPSSLLKVIDPFFVVRRLMQWEGGLLLGRGTTPTTQLLDVEFSPPGAFFSSAPAPAPHRHVQQEKSAAVVRDPYPLRYMSSAAIKAVLSKASAAVVVVPPSADDFANGSHSSSSKLWWAMLQQGGYAKLATTHDRRGVACFQYELPSQWRHASAKASATATSNNKTSPHSPKRTPYRSLAPSVPLSCADQLRYLALGNNDERPSADKTGSRTPSPLPTVTLIGWQTRSGFRVTGENYVAVPTSTLWYRPSNEEHEGVAGLEPNNGAGTALSSSAVDVGNPDASYLYGPAPAAAAAAATSTGTNMQLHAHGSIAFFDAVESLVQSLVPIQLNSSNKLTVE